MTKKIFAYAFLALVLLFVYAPIFVLIVFSFTDTTIIGHWDGFSREVYRELFTDPKLRSMIVNTLVLAALAACISTLLGTVGAVGMFYSKRIWKKLLGGASNVNVINAEIVIAVSLALIFSMLAFNKTYYSLLIGHVAFCTPFVVLSVLPKLKQMDGSLYEAALDLGATPGKALCKVVLPEIFPGVVSGFMLALTLSLDDYIITSFTKPATFDTISTYVYNAIKNPTHSNVPALRALSAIIFLVIVAVVVVLNFRASKKNKQNIYIHKEKQ